MIFGKLFALGVWGSWGQWTECSQTCGTGSQTRNRLCRSEDNLCEGNSTSSKSCNNGNCGKIFCQVEKNILIIGLKFHLILNLTEEINESDFLCLAFSCEICMWISRKHFFIWIQ